MNMLCVHAKACAHVVIADSGNKKESLDVNNRPKPSERNGEKKKKLIDRHVKWKRAKKEHEIIIGDNLTAPYVLG